MGKTIRGGKGIMIDAKLMQDIGDIANESHNGNFSRAVEELCNEAISARTATKEVTE